MKPTIPLLNSLALGCLLASCSSPQQDQTQQIPSDSVSRTPSPSAGTDSITTPVAATLITVKVAPARVAQEVVAALYAAHDAEKSPFFQSESRSRIRQYFAADLAGLIWRDAKSTSRGELGRLDADPLYDGQDTDVKEFIIQPAVVRNNRADVQVTFSSLGAKKTLTYRLQNENGTWRISNILYGDGSQLYRKLTGREVVQ